MVNGPQQQSSLVATASSHSSTSSTQTTRIRTSLLAKSESALTELTAAHHDYISARTTRRHGALALAIGRAQQMLKALDGAREWEQCCLRTSSSSSSSSPSSLSSQTSSRGDDVGLVARLEEVRRRLRRVVERAVSAIDEDGDGSSNNNSSGSGSGGTSSRRSAASSATALRSLLHTRSMLSVELQKMDTAVQGLAGSGEAINTLHNSLQDVHASMATAQRMVRSLLTVQSRDDLVLRLSAVVFVLVVLFILAQRVFRFFPATVYMSVQ